MTYFAPWGAYVIGSIEVSCANMNKLSSITIRGTKSHVQIIGTDTETICGNISVFGNKYDMQGITLPGWKSIVGEVKNLKNLKKLWRLWLDNTSCTGSKTDLYNNGAICTDFRI